MFDVQRRKKIGDGGNVFFKGLAKTFFVNIKKMFMADFDMLYYCYITKSRLDVQFVKKIPLETVIGQQMKEKGYDKN